MLNQNFGALGYIVVGLFALSWTVSIAIYKWRRFEDLELDAQSPIHIEG
jgi:nickel/cobalt transporter (NiCoT) family protein